MNVCHRTRHENITLQMCCVVCVCVCMFVYVGGWMCVYARVRVSACIHGHVLFSIYLHNIVLTATKSLYRVLHTTMGARAMCAYIRAYGESPIFLFLLYVSVLLSSLLDRRQDQSLSPFVSSTTEQVGSFLLSLFFL